MCLMLVAVVALACETDQPFAARPVFDVQQPLDTALVVAADTRIAQGMPNQNYGSETFLRVRDNGNNRSLLAWDTAAIRNAIGTGTLTAARIELTITTNGNNWGTSGRTIDLHRLTQSWTESGSTWKCAVDGNPSNQQTDCSGGTAWLMNNGDSPHPWVTTPTATVTIQNNQSGVVTFDVTADVAAMGSGGGAQYGWILKKTNEAANGLVEFGSRESSAKPRLVLSVSLGQDTARPELPSTFAYPEDTSLFVASPSNSEVRYYRTIIGVRFDDSTGAQRVRSVLSDYSAVIIGGSPASGEYIVRVPDPGPSFSALDSLINRLSNEPGVDYAAGVTFHDAAEPNGRFPSDGSISGRADWIGAPTDATRALRQIRAPLAWGCETGQYGGPRVKIGVLDFLFVTSRDFDSALVSVIEPAANDVTRDSALAASPTRRSHGTFVSSLMAATGNNNKDFAGVIWKNDLSLFALARDTLSAKDMTRFLADSVFDVARRKGVRVLVSSVVVGATDSTRFRRLQRALDRYLEAGSGNLFVMALGNEEITTSLADVSHSGVALLVVAARSLQSHPGNVLLVGGTDTTGAFWHTGQNSGSNFVTGGTNIVAPATRIASLVRQADFGSGAFGVGGGTSAAAPLVGGVAALLWASAPGLSAATVKGLIVDGARWRIAANGDTVQNPSVQNAPETVWSLDAYGSLALLPRREPGTPVCGYPVLAEDNNIFLEKTPGARTALPTTAIADLFTVSVAQGGRLLSAPATIGSTYGIRLFDHTGTLLNTITTADDRRYLETGHADITYVVGNVADGGGNDGDLLERVNIVLPSGVETIYPAREVTTDTTMAVIGTGLEVSPTGEWIAQSSVRVPQTGDAVATWDLIHVPTKTVTNLYAKAFNNSVCNDCPLIRFDRPAWSHDGTRAIVMVPRSDDAGQGHAAYRTEIWTPTVSGDSVTVGTGQIVQGSLMIRPRFVANDSAFLVQELDLALNCSATYRSPFTTGVLSFTATVNARDCDHGDRQPGRIFNAPVVPGTGGTRQQQMVAMLHEMWYRSHPMVQRPQARIASSNRELRTIRDLK